MYDQHSERPAVIPKSTEERWCIKKEEDGDQRGKGIEHSDDMICIIPKWNIRKCRALGDFLRQK
jgi:hypothetical protein